MSRDWKDRLTKKLEPVLMQLDPRPGISAYHDMPCAIFLYHPDDELAVRQEVALFRTRLEQSGKRVTTISLAECMVDAIEAEGHSMEEVAEWERASGVSTTVETLHAILSEYQPLDELVASRIPTDADPERDVVLIVRAGALFPVCRTSPILEQLRGVLSVPAVLFYPGTLDGAAGLCFMGELDAEHNYRAKIF